VGRDEAPRSRTEEAGWSAVAPGLGTGTARRSVVPAEIRNVSFHTAVRGYDRDDVDAYVKHVNRVIAELEVSSSPRAAVRHALDRVGEQVHGILQRARETAEEITRGALEEAEEITGSAKAEAADIVVNASTEADAAKAEADAILAQARAEAERIQAAARTEASEHLRQTEEEAETAREAAAARLQELEDEIRTIVDRRRDLLTAVARLATDLQGLAGNAAAEDSHALDEETEILGEPAASTAEAVAAES